MDVETTYTRPEVYLSTALLWLAILAVVIGIWLFWPSPPPVEKVVIPLQ